MKATLKPIDGKHGVFRLLIDNMTVVEAEELLSAVRVLASPMTLPSRTAKANLHTLRPVLEAGIASVKE